MQTRSCYFKGEAGQRYDLTETDDLIIIRVREGDADSLLGTVRGLGAFRPHVVPFDAFPESGVYLYKCTFRPDTGAFRDEVKRIISASGHPMLCYVGTVLKFTGTEIYQIYTGNLFIKFFDNVNDAQARRTLARSGIRIKSPLGFARNVFFAECGSDIGRDVFDLSQSLLTIPEIEYCHPELVVKTRKVLAADRNIAEPVVAPGLDWVLKKTGVFDAWKIARGQGIRICVIDDGLECEHPAFIPSGKIAAFRDMMDKDAQRFPLHQFDEKHGTACASLACSSDERALGVAPDACLLPVRVAGLGSVLQSEAFYWAAKQKADVISCSWGPPDGNIFTEADNDFVFPIPDHTDLALRYVTSKGRNQKGITVVFAAGNGNEPVQNDGYASHECVIAVGACTASDRPAIYSDYGPPLLCCFPSGDYEFVGKEDVKKLDGIRVADRLGGNGYTQDIYYDFFDGTSASCAGVAGIVALMLSANPELSQGDVRTIIKGAAQKIGDPKSYIRGYSARYGYGMLRADHAVALALNHTTIHSSRPMSTDSASFPRLSLHIGINQVDPSYYKNNLVPELFGCVNDMNNMRALAESLDFVTTTLVNAEATRDAILSQIETLGNRVGSGGLLLITYAGHGAPIPDSDDDEDDRQDESWVTYDGFLIDDELNNCLASIAAGKRVLLISDSCHSQTVSRVFPARRVRCISKEKVRRILAANGQTARSIRAGIGPKKDPEAFIKLLSACRDSQFAKETGGAGVFTTKLLEVFDTLKKSNRKITYSQFIQLINDRMNDQEQIAGLLNTGPASPEFDNQHPFSDGALPNISPTFDSNITKPRLKPRRDTLVVKSSRGSIKIPGLASARSSAFAGDELRINGRNMAQSASAETTTGIIDATAIPGNTPWDKAYQVILSNPGKEIDYVEPEIASNIYLDELVMPHEGSRGAEPEFLTTYPNPGHGPQGFNWHLNDQHSQLKRANETVFPEIKFQDAPGSPERLVKIAHIDTGYLPHHPALPINLDPAAVTFTDDGFEEGAIDFDRPIAIAEQQGHGNGTLALLAGGKLDDEDTNGEFRGFFGAIPFARVLSLKISNTVAILSGKKFAAAVDYAIAQQCDVITMSMAGLPSKVMAEAVNKAYEHGVVIVSAAGNNFVKGLAKVLPKSTLYPARYPQVIAAVGAAFDEKPYLFEAHQADFRSTDGEFMQMNFGPDEVLKSTLAAYTPNVIWCNCDERDAAGQRVCFTKRGGGTSSATPQIAAAAALYIQKYRKELEELAGNDRWKIVEIVQAALFNSASRNNPYLKYYGNGVLRANDALGIQPGTLIHQIQRAKPAEGGGGFFKRFFGVFKNRSAFGTHSEALDTKLQEMMNTEILQLLHRDRTLHKYLDQISLDDQGRPVDYIDNPADFVQDIQKSDKASDFLKRQLRIPSEVTNNNLMAARDFTSTRISTRNGAIEVTLEGVTGSVKEGLKNQTLEDWEGGVYHEFEVEVGETFRSRGGRNGVAIDEDFDADEMDVAVLVQHEVDGQPLLRWQIKGDHANIPNVLRGGANAFELQQGQFFIDLDTPGLRGEVRGGVLKFVVKVFGLFKKKKKKDNEFNELVAHLGDSKYELLVYDLEREHTTGQEWEPIASIPDVIRQINEDEKPLLVLLPGLLSKVEKGFDEFLGNPEVTAGLKTKFGRYVLGYNMPTLLRSIEENAIQFNKMLTDIGLKSKPCSVIGRSSGGLLARYLFEALLPGSPATSVPLVLNKLVVTGTANQGTLLASKENWANYVNIASTVANLAGLLVPIIPKITGILKAIINTAIALPGISDLEEDSEVILKLNQIATDRSGYLVVTSNFEPNGLLKKLFNERIIDRVIFKGEDNDTLAPVLGAIFKKPHSKYNIVLDIRQCCIASEGDQVNHFSYLKPENKEILKTVIEWI